MSSKGSCPVQLPRPLKWKQVDSSAIVAIAYDAQAKQLHVRFQHGGSYMYPGIGRHRFNQLRNAESIGKYFNEAIKPRKAA